MSNINGAESNRASLRYVAEATWGNLPSSGKSRELRITSSSLTATKETAVSEEIRADRMIPSVIETAASSGGDIEFELSAGSLDDFYEAFLLGTWTRPMTFDFFEGSIVSWGTSSRIDINNTTDETAYFVTGRRIKVEGFVNEANNGYFEIASVAFASGVTSVTVTTTTSVIESGNAKSKVSDANDVVILKNTDIRFGTGSAKTIDSNGNNAFASAISADQLVVGQRIFVDTKLGLETGTLTAAGAGVDGETVTISDGVKTIIYEFDSDSIVSSGNVPIDLGASATDAATNLKNAIQASLAAGDISISASSALGVVTVTNLLATGGSLAVTGTNITAVAFSGGDADVGKIYTLTAVSDDVLTVKETISTNANGSNVPVSIKGSHLRNPGDISKIVGHSFTVETGFNDIGRYFLEKGLRVGSMEMSIAAGEIITGKLSFQGADTAASATDTLGNAPYTPLRSTATEVVNATSNVGSVEKDGVTLTTAIQSIDFTAEASLREQRAVSAKFPCGIGVGRFNLTGSLTAYFENLTFFNNFLNHTTHSIGWDFKDVDNNQYFFTIPALKITADPIAPGGIDEDIMEEMEWSAQRDPILNTQFMIDRFSSTKMTTG